MGDRTERSNVVSSAAQADLESPCLAIWSHMDGTLRPDGRGSLARLAKPWSFGSGDRGRLLCPAAGERLVVRALFRLEAACLGPGRHFRALGTSCLHSGGPGTDRRAGRVALASLLAMGQLRRRVEPRHRAPQLVVVPIGLGILGDRRMSYLLGR